MKIGIIIPVVQTEMSLKLLDQLNSGTKKPDKIILIDVSKHGLTPDIIERHYILDYEYIRFTPDTQLQYYKPYLGTNEAWTMGYNMLKQYIPYWGCVGFLNDDIEVNPYFIQSISLAYNTHKNLSLLYPQTISCIEKVQTAQLSYSKIKKTKLRAGYAWFLPRQIFDKIPLFPQQCKIWYGDNWIMYHLHRLEYNLHINIGNWIYHHGQTTSQQLKLDMAKYGINLSRQRREEHKSYLRAVKLWRENND